MNRTLLSLAIIRTNWKLHHHDYIENFVPLFAGLIKQKKYQEISLEKLEVIKNDFKTEYGLVIPSNPTITILNRLSKKKIIIKEKDKFFPNPDKLDSIDISVKSQQIAREFEHVISALQNFVKERHTLSISQSEIEEGLIGYLKKHDLDLLFAAERNSLLPTINPNKKLQYLINEFIGDAYRKEPILFQFILDLTIGHALSATILYEDFNQFSGKFRGLNLFLDTPFIFNLLGIHGILKKSLAEELIYILHEEKVNLFVLEITQSEINGNLEEALKLLERGKSDPTKGSLTFRACIENGFNENDVEQILLSLPSFYAKYKIMYNDLPNYDDFRDFQIDEVKLYNTIVETYDEIIGTKKEKEKNEPECDEKTKDERINNTIFRDVQVLSGIYRYRLGIAPKTLKDCKYLFITTNSSLAHASRRFEKTEQKKRYSLPTCLTDVFLGTLIWLHSPTRLESINEKKIIADSFAALKPDEKLIACYLEDVERLRKSGVIDHDSYILLRTHRAAINILENKTLGDINEFTAQTTEEVLNELIEHIKYQEHEKFIQEKREHEKTQNHLKELREKHSNILEEIKIRDQADLQSAIELNARIQKRAHRNAKTTVLCLQILLASILIGSGLIIFLNQYCNLTIARWFLIVNVALTIISGLLNIITGFNVASIREILLTKLVVVYVDKYKNRVNKYNLSGKVKC